MNNNMNSLGLSKTLSPALSQGSTLIEQQKNRILGKSDNKSARASIKPQKTIIEAFQLSSTITGSNSTTLNNNNGYTPLTKKNIKADEMVIKNKNEVDKNKTQQRIASFNNVTDNLSKFQQGVTNEAQAYVNVNSTPSALNQNHITANNQNIRVNNVGIVNTLPQNSIQNSSPNATINPNMNISASLQNAPPNVNYVPVNKNADGNKVADLALYGESSSKQITLPSGSDGYNMEGNNINVLYPYPNSKSEINKNMIYVNAFTPQGVIGLVPDSLLGTNTTLNCIQRAIDKGFSWCGMNNYGYGGISGGTYLIGNVNNISTYAYKYVNEQLPSANTFSAGYSMLTFGADGILYAGYSGNKFASPITSTINSSLDPTYGGTINNLVARYAYNQGYWNNLPDFSGNYNPTGQPSGTFNTIYRYDIEIPNIGFYTETYYNGWGQSTYEVPYVYYTTQQEQSFAAPNVWGGNLTYINYNCGRTPISTPINIGGQNAGVGYNVDCSKFYSEYPSFILSLSDVGLLTISNSNTSMGTPDTTINMTFSYTKVTLSNGNQVTLNMPRPDWVSGSINGGGTITSSSMNTPSMTNGQWISSPNGFCRLNLSGNTLELEYSLQDVSQDPDGNLVGNNSSIALYYIENVNVSNLGMSAHVDINGALNVYPQGTNMIGYSNTYTKMSGYIPNPASLNGSNTTTNISQTKCEDICNNTTGCVGYVHSGYSSTCNTITNSIEIFPVGDRAPNPEFDTYIRNQNFPSSHQSCRVGLDSVVDSSVSTYYLNNGITPNPNQPNVMTPDTKCNLGKVLDSQMRELSIKNAAAVERGEEIKGQFGELFNRENTILNDISNNRRNAKNSDSLTKVTDDKIQDIENAQITKKAAEKDSELLLISDNYKYVIWGIISLLLSIATIKGLRVASS